VEDLITNVLDFLHFCSALYWERSACQASEEQKDKLKSSNKFEGKRPFVKNCCGCILKFTFCVNKDGFYCVLYLYRTVNRMCTDVVNLRVKDWWVLHVENC